MDERVNSFSRSCTANFAVGLCAVTMNSFYHILNRGLLVFILLKEVSEVQINYNVYDHKINNMAAAYKTLRYMTLPPVSCPAPQLHLVVPSATLPLAFPDPAGIAPKKNKKEADTFLN